MKKIVVVGAGIVGICTAYFLQKSGFKVTIIDKPQNGGRKKTQRRRLKKQKGGKKTQKRKLKIHN